MRCDRRQVAQHGLQRIVVVDGPGTIKRGQLFNTLA